MKTILNIKTIEDIKTIQEAILNNNDFEIGDVLPIKYTVKLTGGRFENYDINYINADVAKIVLSEQENYTKLLNELTKKFNIEFSEESKILKFKLQKGSLEFINETLSMLEVVKNMESQDIMYLFLGISSMWFGHSAFSKYLEKEIKKIEALKEKTKDEETKNIVTHTIDALKDIALNKPMQDSINNRTKTILSVLKDDEKFTDGNNTLDNNNLSDYEYSKPLLEDIEEEITKDYKVESYNFYKEGKLFKLVGIRPLANSEILSAEKRIKLLQEADKKNTVKLKVKIIKDGLSESIKNVYILDLIQ